MGPAVNAAVSPAARSSPRLTIALIALTLASGCAHGPSNPYESSTSGEQARFKRVMLPFAPGTRFKISQGAFGWSTHHDPGHEYTWDFDVPYGTPVLSVEDGIVIGNYEPPGGGGCDPVFNDAPHTLHVRHEDGTVAQYVHIQSRVNVGQRVRKGEVIAVTAKNGFICTPQLDFGVYQDEQHLYGSRRMRNIPLLFNGLPDGGVAREGHSGQVPR